MGQADPPTVDRFLAARCEAVEGAEVHVAELFAEYEMWARGKDGAPLTKVGFGRVITAAGYPIQRRATGRFRVGLMVMARPRLTLAPPPAEAPEDEAIAFPSPPPTGLDLDGAPPHLSKNAAAWWESVVKEYEPDGAELRLLTLAAEAWDRAQQARAEIGDRLMIETVRGEVAHPLISVAERSASLFARLVKQLGLGSEEAPAARGWGRT